MDCTGQHQGVVRAVSLLKAAGEKNIPFPLWLPEAVCIPWLVALSTTSKLTVSSNIPLPLSLALLFYL